MGGEMIVYVDLVFLLNIYLDFLILLTTALILKRNTSLKRIFLGSLVGGMTTILLFFKINSYLLFLGKVGFSLLMILVTFSFKNWKYFLNNLVYLYITSIVLGGGLYLLDLEFSLDNIIFVLLGSFFILIAYLKQLDKLRNNYNNYLRVEIEYHNDKYNFIGFIDSGNNLRDQYKNRPISILYSEDFQYEYEDIVLVPYETASGSGVLQCIKVNKMIVDNHTYKNSLIGLKRDKLKIDGVDIILNNQYMGG